METASESSLGGMVIIPSGGDLVDRLDGFERARCRIVFEQYEAAVELLRSRVCERISAGQPQDRWEAGIAGELALALRMSPHKGP